MYHKTSKETPHHVDDIDWNHFEHSPVEAKAAYTMSVEFAMVSATHCVQTRRPSSALPRVASDRRFITALT